MDEVSNFCTGEGGGLGISMSYLGLMMERQPRKALRALPRPAASLPRLLRGRQAWRAVVPLENCLDNQRRPPPAASPAC